MKQPSESASSWVHIAYAAYTLASLRAWAEFRDLTEDQRAAVAGLAEGLEGRIRALLKEARETEDQLIFGRPQAQARRNAWLMLLHRRVVEALALVVLRLGGNSKDHPAVRAFLPNLLEGVSAAALADRPALVKTAAKRLEGLADFAEKAAQLLRLNEVAAGAEAAIEAAEDAWNSWVSERSEEVVEKGKLRLELERVHGQLKTLFPGQRAFVESFFVRGKTTVEDPGEPAPVEPATEPTA